MYARLCDRALRDPDGDCGGSDWPLPSCCVFRDAQTASLHSSTMLLFRHSDIVQALDDGTGLLLCRPAATMTARHAAQGREPRACIHLPCKKWT